MLGFCEARIAGTTANLSLVLGLLAEEVLGLAVLIKVSLLLLASVAVHAALEVVVLAVAAHPATIREVKVVLALTLD